MKRAATGRPILAGRVVGLGLGRVAWAGAGVALLAGTAPAGPEGAKVRHGDVAFARRGDTTVVRASDRAIIDYRSFDIAAHETVRFVQPSADARVLNRVQGADPTRIDGTLLANGRVYIVNPAGVYFGDGALVNVGALYAAAAHLSDADFLNNVDRFTDARGEAVNRGHIAAARVALIGRRVTNAGLIVAEEGTVALAAGEDVLVGEEDGHVFARFSGAGAAAPGGRAGVVNSGEVRAPGGQALFGAADAFAVAIDLPGAVHADSILARADAGAVTVRGTLDASSPRPGSPGGRIEVFGKHVGVFGGTLDASGPAGGGTILVGGDFQGRGEAPTAARTIVAPGSTLRADATERGDGGRIIVWSDGWTAYQGGLSARGGPAGGDAGFAEVSGRESLLFRGGADLRAPAGAPGRLLLDPKNIVVADAGPGGGGLPLITFAADPAATETIDADAITAFTNQGVAVTLQASNDITVNEAILTDNPGGDGGDLTLQAGRSITINADIATDNGALTLVANETLINGVLDAHRDAGAAGLTLGPGVGVRAGSGAAALLLGTGAGLTNNDSGVLLVSGLLEGGAVSAADRGPDEAGATVATTGRVAGGSVLLVSNGSLTLDGPVDAAQDATLSGGDDGGGNVVLNAALTTGGPLSVSAGTNISWGFSGSVDTGGGNALFQANRHVTLRNVLTRGGDLDIRTDLDGSGVGSLLQVSATSSRTEGGDISLRTVNVILNGSLNAGAGDILIEPSDPAGTMGLASPTGTLLLDSVELASGVRTTGSLTLGRADGTGAVHCGNLIFTTASPFDLTIRGGAINARAIILGRAGAPSLALVANTGAITQDGPPYLPLFSVAPGGTITLRANDVVLPAGNLLVAGSGGAVAFEPNAGVSLGLGGGAGGFSLSSAEVSGVRAGTLIIGSSTSGRMTVGTVSAPAEVSSLVLRSGADIVEAAANTITDVTVAGRLTLEAVDGIGTFGGSGALDASLQQLTAAVSGAGGVALRLASGGLLESVTTADGGIEIAGAAGNLVVGAVQAGNAGAVTLDAQAGAIFDDASDATGLTTAGAVSLSAAAGLGQDGGPGGTGSSLDLDVGAVSAAAAGTGGVALRLIDADAGGVTLSGVDAGAAGDAALSADAGAGTITINGLQTADGSVSVDANGADLVLAGPVTADAGGGTGGVGTIAVADAGAVTLSGALTTDTGAISITADSGVLLAGPGASARVQAGPGGVTIGADDDADGFGGFTVDDALGELRSAGGAIAVSAADIALDGVIDAAGAVTLQPSAAGLGVALGTLAPADFSLSDAELGRITASTLVVGHAQRANTFTVGTISPAGAANLTLQTAAGIAEETPDTATDITVTGTLTLAAAAGVGSPGALGALDISAGLLAAASVTGDIHLRSPADLNLGLVSAGARDAFLATPGAILDGNGAATNIASLGVTLSAGGAIGSAPEPLDLAVGRVVAASTGDITLRQGGNVTLTSVVATGGGVSITVAQGDVALNEVRAGLGALSISVPDGGIVEAGGGDPGADLLAAALVLSTGEGVGLPGSPPSPVETDADAITVQAGGGVYLADLGSVTLADVAAAAGDVAITASGALTASSVRADAGGVALSGASLAIDLVDAGAGDATLQALAGDIAAADADAEDDVCGDGVSLTAAGGVGVGPFVLTICPEACLSADAGGSLTLHSSGDMLLDSLSASAITLAAGGSILECFGDGGAAEITAPTVSLTAVGDIRGEAPGTPLELDAGTLTATAGGPVNLRSVGAGITLASVVSASGDAVVSAASGDVLVGFLSAAGGAGAVTLTAEAGRIAESGADPGDDIVGGALTFTARDGIGHAGAIELNGDSLRATVSGPAGDIRIAEADETSLLAVAGPGDAEITGGTLLATGDVSAGGALLLHAANITITGNVSGAQSVTLRGSGATLGGIGLAAGGTLASPGDITVERTRTATLAKAVHAGGTLRLSEAGTANINASFSAGDALSIADVGVVNLAQGVGLAAGAGGVAAQAGVGVVNLAGASGTNTVSTTADGDVALAPVAGSAGASLAVDSTGSVDLAGVSLTGAAGSGLIVVADADDDSARTLRTGPLAARAITLSAGPALDDSILLRGPVSAGAGGLVISGAALLDADADIASGSTLAVRDATVVDLARGAAISSVGDLSVLTGVGRITLSGDGGVNSFSAAGDGSVSLAPVLSSTGASLAVAAEGGAVLRGVNLDGPAGAVGAISAAIDTDDDTPGALLTIGASRARRTDLLGGGLLDDAIILNGVTATTAGPLVAGRAASISVNRSVDAAAGLTLFDAGVVNLRPGAHLTARGGNLSVFSGVGRLSLTPGSADTTLTAASDSRVLLSAVEASPGATGTLVIDAQGGADVGGASLHGPLAVTVDSNGNGAEVLSLGAARAAAITLAGGAAPSADDTLSLLGPLQATAGDLTIRDAASVTLAPGVLLEAPAGGVSVSANVGGITLVGAGTRRVTALRDVTLAPVGSPAGSLEVAAGRSITLGVTDLPLGDLRLRVDTDGSGDGVLTLAGVSSAATVAASSGSGGPPTGRAVLAGGVAAAGDITLDLPVVLGAADVDVQSRSGDVRLGSTVDADSVAATRHVRLLGRDVTLAGPVGGDQAPDSILVSNSGLFTLLGEARAGGDVAQTGPGGVRLGAGVNAGGSISFDSPIILTADASLRAQGGARLGSTVDGPFHLVLAAPGGVTLGGDAGASAALGSLTVNGDALLARSLSVRATGLSFNGDLDAAGPGVSLSLDSTAGTRLRGDAGSRAPRLAALDVSGPFTVGGPGPVSVSTLQSQTYSGAVTLAGDAAFDAGSSVRFASTINGPFRLEVAAPARVRLAGGVGQTAPLALASFDAPVVIERGLGVSAAEVRFRRTIDASAPGLDLAVTTSQGGAFFDGSVGLTPSLHAPRSLDVTGGAVLASDGQAVEVRTSGPQVWRGDVSLGADTTFTSTDPAALPGDRIAFLDDVTDGEGASALRVNNPGDTRLAATAAVASLRTDAGGRTIIAGPAIATDSSQVYGDAVVVESPAVAFSGRGIGFAGVLEAAPSVAPMVSIADSGTTLFSGAVGGSAPGPGALGSLAITGGGLTRVAGGSVRTIGSQDFANALELAVDTLLAGSAVRFGGSLGSAEPPGPAANLRILAPATRFDGPGPGGFPLASLRVEGAAEINAPVTTVGLQAYAGPVAVLGEVALTSTGSGPVGFGADVTGPGSLRVVTGGLTRFLGDLSVRQIESVGGGLTELHDPFVQTGGDQTWGDALRLPQGTTFTAADDGARIRLLGGLAPAEGAGPIGVAVVLSGPGSAAEVAGDFAAASLTFDAPVVVVGDASMRAAQSIAFLGTLDGTPASPDAALSLAVADAPVPRNREAMSGPIPTVRFTGDVGGSAPLGSLTIGNPASPRAQPPPVASIVAAPRDPQDARDGSYSIGIRVAGDFTMAPNEKLTVLGDLDLRAGRAAVGDIAALRSLRVAADAVTIIGRASGALAVPVNGELQVVSEGENSEAADNSGTDFVAADSITFQGAVTREGVGEDFNVRFATNTGEGVVGVDTFIRTRVEPPLDFDRLVFVGEAPIVLDVKAGAAPINVASSLAGALPREQRVLDVPQDAVAVLSVANELQEIGILLDRGGVEALESALGRALYEDLRMPSTARRHANQPRGMVLERGEEVYYKPSRLSGEAALEMRDTIRELFLYQDGRAQLALVKQRLTDAWLAWLDTPGTDPSVPGAFRDYLESTDPGGDAARCVRALARLFDQIDALGLTDYERQQVRRFVLRKVAPERVRPEALEFAALSPAPAPEPPGDAPAPGAGQ